MTRTLDFDFDQNYWIDDVAGSALDLDLATNEIGNIVGLDAATAANERVYDYDPLSRLQSVSDGSASVLEAFTYDGTGNCLSRQTAGVTQSYGYPLDSHRLASVGGTTRDYDAMGSLTDRGDGWTFEYDARQRLHEVRQNGDLTQLNAYSGKGERVTKTSVDGTTVFVYDESGRLLAEHRTPTFLPGSIQREYVWLDDRPVAILVNVGAYGGETLHVHSDHLGTPRAVTRPAASNAVVWRWDLQGASFGDHPPSEDPDADGMGLVVNLRYPGQYFDSESGLHYNYFRDFEPGTGRYVESDPIGLRGGMSLYGYVTGNPLSAADPYGLFKVDPSCEECGWDADVQREGDAACAAVATTITDPKLRKCIQKRCKKAKIVCDEGCELGDIGENTYFAGIYSSTARICVNNIKSPAIVGDLVIHEWAHSCRWDHFDGMGVPGNNGYMTQ